MKSICFRVVNRLSLHGCAPVTSDVVVEPAQPSLLGVSSDAFSHDFSHDSHMTCHMTSSLGYALALFMISRVGSRSAIAPGNNES